MLSRITRENKVDFRTGPGKALKHVSAELTAEWPCQIEDMPAEARFLIDPTAGAWVRLMLRIQRMIRAAGEGRFEVDENEKWMVAMMNTVRRNLETLEQMRLRFQAERPQGPTLQEYLQQRDAEAAARNASGPESDAAAPARVDVPSDPADAGEDGEGE
jgi:hypothetical protein